MDPKKGIDGERLACPLCLEGIPFVLPNVRDVVMVRVWSRTVARWLIEQSYKTRPGKPRSKWLAVHLSTSLHPDEPWEAEKLQEWTRGIVGEVMPGKRSALYATHLDHHTHAIVMVVNSEGTIWNPRLDFRLWELAAERCEVANKLHRVETRKGAGRFADKTGVKAEEMNMVLRTNEISAKMALQDAIDAALVEAKTLAEFLDKIQAAGIEAQLNRSKTTGYVSGISYRKGDFIMKGSALGKRYAWKALADRFNTVDYRDLDRMERERDREQIVIECKAKAEPKRKQYKKTLELCFKSEPEGVFSWNRSGRVAFIDEGNRISLESENRTALRAALQLAKSKGWTQVIVSGSAGFQLAAQVMAEKMGIKTYGNRINQERTAGGNPIPVLNLPAIPAIPTVGR